MSVERSEPALDRVWYQAYDEGVPRSIDYPEKTIYQLFLDAVESQPSSPATYFFGARLTFRDLASRIDQFASVLAGLGVGQGDRVALILPNYPLYPIAHLAVMKLGGVLVPTNPLYVERELVYQLNDAGAETAIVLEPLYQRLASVREQTRLRNVIVSGVQDFLPFVLRFLYRLKNRSRFRSEPAEGVHTYAELMAKRSPEVKAAEVSPDDTAILLYTGGTTGVSKGAVLTYRNLTVNVYQTASWLWDLKTGEEVLLCVLPFFHSYGMTTGLHLSILSRSAMVLVPRFDIKEVVKRIRRHKPTVFCGVPSMYNAINMYPGISKQEVSSIRLCVSGGAALPEEVQRRFEELTGGRLVEGYGLSETSPVALVNPIYGKRKLGTIGIPVPDTNAQIFDPESGESLPPGEVGELCIRGPQVMRQYWNREEETCLVLRDGWLYTGDMARMDEEGFFTIVDRSKDVIISAGMNIYPREIEEVLHSHPKIAEAAVLAVPSKVRQEVVKAFLVLKEGESATKSEIIQFCRDKLAKHKIPREVEFRKELPKSAIGKILKRKLKEEAEKETGD